jgi:hypothetical protein
MKQEPIVSPPSKLLLKSIKALGKVSKSKQLKIINSDEK